MDEIRWELYPLVAASERSRAWLQLQWYLQLAPKRLTPMGAASTTFWTFVNGQKLSLKPSRVNRSRSTFTILLTAPIQRGLRCSPLSMGRAYQTRRCNNALPCYACFAIPWWNNTSAKTIPLVEAATCLEKLSEASEIGRCFPTITSSPGCQAMRSGKPCYAA